MLKKLNTVAQAICQYFQYIFFKLVKGPDPYKYTLSGDRLYTRESTHVKNSRVKIIKWGYCNSKDIQTIDDDIYLLVLYEDNLAHFFHDIFFPLYAIWRNNNKKIFASINENIFLRDFLIAVFGEKNVIFSKKTVSYKFKKLILTPEGRDLKIYPNYLDICKEIKIRCLQSLGVVENRTRNIIYARTELQRKNLLNIDQKFLELNQLESLPLSKFTFKELVSVLAQAKTFTYMVGAGVFYLLFLDTRVPVLEINPAKNNSWAQMFGLSNVCQLNVLVSNNIEICYRAAQGEPILDSHVYFDENIKQHIKELLSQH